MNEIDIFDKLNTLSLADSSSGPFNSDEVAKHKIWLNSIRRERPNTATQSIFSVNPDSESAQSLL